VWYWLGAGGGRERGTRAAKQIGRKKKADFFSRHHPIFFGGPNASITEDPVANEAKGEKSIPESKVKNMGEEWAKKTATKRADFFSEPHRPRAG
jgi:hypothetical protein